MNTIRQGVFETNSSSTHSITIMTKEEFESWKNEEILYDENNEIFVDNIEENQEINGIQSFNEFYNDCMLETDINHYKSPSGDKLVIICKYGNDY